MRRAAVLIPANIAEGFKKRGLSVKTRFLNIAQGSLEECRYYLILTQDLAYGSATNAEALLEEGLQVADCLRERNRVQPVTHC